MKYEWQVLIVLKRHQALWLNTNTINTIIIRTTKEIEHVKYRIFSNITITINVIVIELFQNC